MEDEISNKKDRRRALVGTLLFHAVLCILFLFYGLKEPQPPREEQMVSIDMDFGTDMRGQGDQESPQEDVEEPTKDQTEKTEEVQEEEAPPSSNDVPTQQESDVNVEEDDEEERQEGEESSEEAEQEREENEERREAMEQFKEMEDDGGGGEGDDEEAGNEGDPSGKPDGEGRLGGAGGSWKLAGREILRKPQPAKPKEEGRVVLDIWVDRQGNVIRTSLNMSQSNTTSDELVRIATKAAKEAKFNPDPEGSAQQKGSFTFLFELR